jgi:hypothetical protein
MTQEPGAVFEATYDAGTQGLAGNMAVAIQDNQQNVVFGPTTLQIVELIVGGSPTGMYRAMLTAPAVEGQFSIIWSNDGSFIPDHGEGEEDLLVSHEQLVLPPVGGGSLAGGKLCNAWTTSQDVALFCADENVDTSDTTLLDESVVVSSEILYEASGRQFPGLCTSTVRPNRTDPCRFSLQVLPSGYVVGWGDWGWLWYTWDRYYYEGLNGGCKPVSRVKLAGTVQDVIEVRIDGAVVDPLTYRLDEERWLVRTNDGLGIGDAVRMWPRCQLLDRDDDQPGTFSVTYEYGKVVPFAGELAARQMACEIFKSLVGAECSLPTGVTRITRQGLTIERSFLQRDATGIWRTGLSLVDLFLNSVNPQGIRRRATFFAPNNKNRYARRAGVSGHFGS